MGPRIKTPGRGNAVAGRTPGQGRKFFSGEGIAPEPIFGGGISRSDPGLGEGRSRVAAIQQRLMERGYTGSYASVWRFVNTIKADGPPETVTRVETKPGEEAQVDFGYAGRMIDPASGELRKAWAFVMLLSWSLNLYVQFVRDQKVETFLSCHRKAFGFLGGVPERVRIDNLKAAILKAVFDEPQVQYTYRECAEHYGFLTPAPTEVRCRTRPSGHARAQRQGRAGRSALRLPQLLGLKDPDHAHPGEFGCAGLVRHCRRAAHPRHDERKALGKVRADRKGHPEAAARKPL
jgi:hypothetical protein